ncbi:MULTISPECIES: CDP-diacylglycerol--glycerol-3-phosphate 3-phosphatidyltransferase [Prosthecochloris]|uniref:CDP-diacylglycerol--glycerol-3-phosphate 3-phosphatidyltransferase n=1 Tax=Prosthecochloris vibrioformis TaxID=1098 RepID=A0A5C4S0D6_PROVB|nr:MULTISPECIES: CDP-diacylglycerol--glycerol-3-phosphate 3-phosphatidyltransferase [Prosthecochloris]ANT64283.1 CDP-diacylglycerol--glycerol-3-phosphate 3-phosphatidyltransferase [Prosthecochloris sp. CIB 2401]TNJ36705.1 CDP-diacylglycerol--glycerol-3-phosphate 3-phosphatidyltransferase [Prosthecochloris vibrioformis]
MTLPNQLTILRILLVPLFVYLLMLPSALMKLAGVAVFVIASVTDAFDGYYARKHGQTTRLGAFLDPLADKFLITAAFLVYVWYGYIDLWMVVLVALRDVLVTILRVYAEWRDRPVITSREAKYKTLSQNLLAYLVMLLMILGEPGMAGASVASFSSGLLVSPLLDYLMLGVTIFTVYTGISYLVQNREHLFARGGVS